MGFEPGNDLQNVLCLLLKHEKHKMKGESFLFFYCLVFVMTQTQQTARKLYLYHKDSTYCNSLVTRERERARESASIQF